MAKYLDIIQKFHKDTTDEKVFKERSLQSLHWYRQKMQSYFGNRMVPIGDSDDGAQNITSVDLGQIYAFKYRPKGRKTLPFYDKFPLVLVIKKVPGGFLGLNFHYLHPFDRAVFMDRLYDFEVPDTGRATIRININYPILRDTRRLSFYRACIKRYRYFNIANFFIKLTPAEWDIALFLPTEKFVGAKRTDIWDDSRSKY